MSAIPLSDLPDDFRTFAVAWLGFDPWIFGGVWSGPGPGPWRRVPLHTGAGFALGLAYLAKKLEAPAKFTAEGLLWLEMVDGDGVRLGWMLYAGLRQSDGRGPGWYRCFYDRSNPGLADIPTDCPRCKGSGVERWIEPHWAGEGDPRENPQERGCPDCTDGTNPHRPEQALAACLRSLS